jgi:hypothetical protein
MIPLFQQLTPPYFFCYICCTDAGTCRYVFHGTLHHLTLVHTYLGHFQGLKALCIDSSYFFSDCLHFHGGMFCGKVRGLTAVTVQKLGKNHQCVIAEHSIAEAHSQLCLVVPSLRGVDCVKHEGNMTD